jgi:hypothetical protein
VTDALTGAIDIGGGVTLKPSDADYAKAAVISAIANSLQLGKNDRKSNLDTPLQRLVHNAMSGAEVMRLEQYLPAQLDTAMRQRLADELYEQWLQLQLKQLIAESSP